MHTKAKYIEGNEMELTDYLEGNDIKNNSIFHDLGYSDSTGNNILTFCDTIHYLNIAQSNPCISAVIVPEKLISYIKNKTIGIAISETPRDTFYKLYNNLRENNLFPKLLNTGIEETSIIADSAIVSKNSYIGKNTVISENVVIKENVIIGDNCFIDVGCIIGNEGLLYFKDTDENNKFIKHSGIVEIGSNVTLLSSSIVVKSIFQNMPTKINDFSIIGIGTTIGHESSIGKNCIISGKCVIAKNVTIHDNSYLGTSVVIRENLTLGISSNVKAGSVVIKSVKEHESVSGNFAINHNINLKNYFKSLK